jgi:hypothetical protein
MFSCKFIKIAGELEKGEWESIKCFIARPLLLLQEERKTISYFLRNVIYSSIAILPFGVFD